jgi:hypothetical protein
MWKAALAGAIALAAVGVLPASAGENVTGNSNAAHSSNDAVEWKIANAKSALRLRPDQERHWGRVAAAIRDWAGQSARQSNGYGLVEQARSGAAALASQARGAKRVVVAAAPLMRTLDAEQRQTALGMVRALGFGHLAAAL